MLHRPKLQSSRVPLPPGSTVQCLSVQRGTCDHTCCNLHALPEVFNDTCRSESVVSKVLIQMHFMHQIVLYNCCFVVSYKQQSAIHLLTGHCVST